VSELPRIVTLCVHFLNLSIQIVLYFSYEKMKISKHQYLNIVAGRGLQSLVHAYNMKASEK
jgi:hypothetical protein